MKTRHLIIGLAALALAACAATKGETPQQVVFGLKSDYRAVLTPIVEYESLPRCTGEVPVAPAPGQFACSDKEVVEILRRADKHAATALDSAEYVVRSPTASESTINLAIESAIAALAALTQVLVDEGIYQEAVQ